MVTLAAVIAFSLASCAAPEAAPPAPAPATTQATPEPEEPKPGDAAISPAHVCGQVTTLLTMEMNAVLGVEAEAITPAEYEETIDDVVNGYHHVLFDDSDVGKAVRAATIYLETMEATGDGGSYDLHSGEWGALGSTIAQACKEAGSDVTALLDFGG